MQRDTTQKAYGLAQAVCAETEIIMDYNKNSHLQTIPKPSARWRKRKIFFCCAIGVILILFSSFLLFTIWISRADDHETPLYVYLALTFAFGLLILCGIFLILFPRKCNSDISIVEIPLQHVYTIVKSNIYYVDEHLEQKGDYKSISPRKCASTWYKMYHEPTMFSFIRRIHNRYIGDRAWIVGGTSYISLCDGKVMVHFTIDTPANTLSLEYVQAREKWEAVVRKIYDVGWLLFDKM